MKDQCNSLKNHLKLLGNNATLINSVNIGLERETLRVNPENGHISQGDHPKSLGSPLTNSHITTDFSESLLEFVTDPKDSPDAALEELREIQQFTLNALENNELFWPNSMPPAIASEDEISIAKYGSSNDAKMKSLYRKGLSLRYGKMMQVISGIHYNFSFKDSLFEFLQKALNNHDSLQTFKTERYLHACRNVSRYGIIIPFFLGSSPVMDKTFLAGKPNAFVSLNCSDSYLPDGESLRLSDIGYGNNKCHFDVSFNNIDDFVNNIHYAISTPCSNFSKIPVIENGEYNQINNHILQIENEYYASVRPKQIIKKGENFLTALKKRGIEYIELRSIDINPLIPEGIDLESMRLIQMFLTASVLTDAEVLSQQEYEANQKNLKTVAKQGLVLKDVITINNITATIDSHLRAILAWLKPVADILGEQYVATLTHFEQKINDTTQLPSQKVLSTLMQSELPYQEFFLQQAKHLFNRETYRLDQQKTLQMQDEANKSLESLAKIESAPQISFEEYLDNYFKF